VHDFIYQAIYGALQQSISSPELSYNEEENEECSTFHEKEIHFPPMKEYVRQPQQASIDRTEQLKNAVDSTPNYPNKAPSDSWVSNSPSISKSSSSNGRSITYQNDRPSQKELTNYSALLNTPVEDKRSTNHQVNEGHLRHLSDIPTVESYVPILSIVDDKVVSLGKVLTVVEKGFALLQKGEQLQLLNLHYAEFVKSYGQLNSVHNEALRAQPLLIPLSIGVEETICRKVLDYALFLKPLGIDLKVKNRTSVIVMAVCQPIRQQNLQQLIPNLLRYLDSINPSLEQVIIWLSHQVQHEEVSYSNAQAIQLVMELEQLWGDGLSQFNQKLLKNIDITQVIQAFSHE
jgi:DNA mismatch repair protein MutL